jgi:1-acyl-sn-glycerol-3-phosphate acyltransferase
VLPRFRFVAKAELSRIPIFGPAAGKAAAIYIERANRKAAFDSYKSAVDEIKKGYAVCVYPEGTRGYNYSLRPFKKGPFVFAIASGVPIVPVVTHGTIDIQPKGRARVRPGTVHLHFLEEVPTAGLAYEDRAELMEVVWGRMAAALRDLYGVESRGGPLARDPEAEKIKTSFL